MSNVEDRMEELDHARAIDARYSEAKREIEHFQRVEKGQAGALMFAALAYGDTLEGSRFLQVASHWARLFCIASIFVIPNLLAIAVLF